MKNIILISNGETEQFDNIDELKEFIVSDWKKMSQEEIEKILYEKVFGISKWENLQIINTKKGVYEDDFLIGTQEIKTDKAIIIDSIETFLLSLCKFEIITILEEKENGAFTKDINLEISEDDNYIIINAYANAILNMMVGDSYDG